MLSVKEKMSELITLAKVHKKLTIGATSTAVMITFPTVAMADGTGGTSLITPEITAIITNFANQIVPTILSILVIVVPVGLSCWAIGFATKKALGFLQKKASKAL